MIIILLSPLGGRADNLKINGYVEAGTWSATPDYEEDMDASFTYQNYHLGLAQTISQRLKYTASAFLYDKNYRQSDSLNNVCRIFSSLWSYDFKQPKKQSLQTDLAFKYRGKRYQDMPTKSYDQVMVKPSLKFEVPDLYMIYFASGIESFRYPDQDNKNQLALSGKIGGEKYFRQKKLVLSLTYKMEHLNQKQVNRKKVKHDLAAGMDYKFGLRWIDKINAGASWGQRDTKDDDQRDEDYDYRYRRYFIKTTHKISDKLKTDLKYEFFKKDYISAHLGHRFFYISSGWDYEIHDNKKCRFALGVDAAHRRVDYVQGESADYRKETAAIETSYRKTKDWKAALGWEESFYVYNDSSKNKRRHYVFVSLEKYLMAQALVLDIDFKYRFTDYRYDNDEKQDTARLGLEYRF